MTHGTTLPTSSPPNAGRDQPATRRYFDTPIRVKAGGANTLRDVRSVEGACEVLIDWPHARRGPYYQAAMEVVNAALEGKASVAQAHDAFMDLCAHAGILVDPYGA